ncbi:MAG TPA: PAS domain S-box protein, partial [Burkholderiales bacterium]|nr:PAS domain S-box protein [Burkholderiales bacterium]
MTALDVTWGIPLGVTLALGALAGLHFGAFHVLAQLLAAACAVMMLVAVSNASSAARTRVLRFVAFGLPAIALLDVAQAWLGGLWLQLATDDQLLSLSQFACVLQAALIAAAPLLARRRLVAVLTLGAVWALAVAGLAAVLSDALPRHGGAGVSPQEILLQLAAFLALAMTYLRLDRGAERLEPSVRSALRGAIGATALAGLAFALAEHPADAAGVAGHLARLWSLWLLYVAAAQAGIVLPRALDRRYREMFKSTVVGVALTRPDGTFLTVNRAYARIFGYDSAAPLLAAVPNSAALYTDPAVREAIVQELATRNALRDMEVRMRRADGAVRWITGNVAALRNRAGQLVAIQSAVFDITEARQAREQARLEESRLRKLVEVLPVGVWMTDETGRIVLGNAAGRQIWAGARYVGIEQYGEYKGSWLHSGRAIAAEEWPLARALTHGETRIGDEIEIECFDGTRKVIRNAAAPILDDAGQRIGALVVNEDITEAKRREAELERLADIVEASDDAILQVDVLGTILTWNDGARRLYGYEPHEILGQPVSRLIPQELQAAEQGILERVLAGERVPSFDTVRLRRDGSRVHISLGLAPLRDETGRITGAARIGRDITERLAQERALHESVARGEILAKATNDAVWDWTLETGAVAWNEGYRALFGHSPAPTLESWTDYLHPEDKAAVLESIHAAIDDGTQAWSGEYRFLRADGTYADVFDRGFLVRDGGGRPVRMIGAMMDISERKRAERALRESETRFRSLVELSSDWYWELDEELRFVRLDGGAARRSTLPPAEMLGKRRWEVPGLAPIAGGWDEHRAVLAARKPFRGLECRQELPNGEAGYLELSGEPVFDAHGRFSGYRGVGTDITARKRMEEALRRREQDFRTLVQNLPDVVSRFDRNLVCHFINDAVIRFTGRAPAFYLGRALEAMDLPEPFLQIFGSACRKCVAAGVEQQEEFPFPGEKGMLHFEARFLPERDAAGTIVSVMAIARDVTARVRAAEELRRQEAYYRSLVENVSDTICATDAAWRFVYVSPSSATLLGYRPDELLGRRFGDTTVLDDPAGLRERFERQLNGREPRQPVQVRVRRRDGEVRHQEVVVSQGTSPGGEAIRVLASRDITDRIRAEEEYRALAQNLPDGVFRVDAELRCTFVNAAVEKGTGFAAAALVGRSLREPPMPEDVRATWEPAIRRVLDGAEVVTAEYSFAGPRGLRHYQARFAPERTPGGGVGAVLVISRDITERKRAERITAESEARLKGIVQATAEPLLLIDPQGNTLFANPAAATLFGRRIEELEGAPLGLPLADGRPADVEIVLPGGAIRPAEMQVASTEVEGKPVLVVSLHDLSERKRYEAHIQHLANHDALTGLPNRTLLRDRVEQAIVHARRTSGYVGLIFVDLDHFKLVNDSWGHGEGDALLLEVSTRLQKAVRPGDTVARLGGDEFVILLVDLAQPGDTAVVARKLAEALERPVQLASRELRVTASMGIAVFP